MRKFNEKIIENDDGSFLGFIRHKLPVLDLNLLKALSSAKK